MITLCSSGGFNLRSDLRDSISKVFGPALVSSVFSIDSTAVLVQFSKQESVNDFLDLKDDLERTDSAISILHPLSTIMEGGCTRAVKYDTYRDICSSSESKYLFADQAEAVYPLPEDQLWENVDGNVISGVHDGILELASIKKGRWNDAAQRIKRTVIFRVRKS
jgi:poly(A)-specific ribonuclease